MCVCVWYASYFKTKNGWFHLHWGVHFFPLWTIYTRNRKKALFLNWGQLEATIFLYVLSWEENWRENNKITLTSILKPLKMPIKEDGTILACKQFVFFCLILAVSTHCWKETTFYPSFYFDWCSLLYLPSLLTHRQIFLFFRHFIPIKWQVLSLMLFKWEV